MHRGVSGRWSSRPSHCTAALAGRPEAGDSTYLRDTCLMLPLAGRESAPGSGRGGSGQKRRRGERRPEGNGRYPRLAALGIQFGATPALVSEVAKVVGVVLSVFFPWGGSAGSSPFSSLQIP